MGREGTFRKELEIDADNYHVVLFGNAQPIVTSGNTFYIRDTKTEKCKFFFKSIKK